MRVSGDLSLISQSMHIDSATYCTICRDLPLHSIEVVLMTERLNCGAFWYFSIYL
jgi:hypothetical protein